MRVGLAFVLTLGTLIQSNAAEGVDAQWMWVGGGNPQQEAPAGKVWFRRDIRVDEPSTCALSIAVDDSFVLFVNGKKVGEGKSGKAHRFNLNGIVSEGNNVFAIEVTNDGGPAGIIVEGMVRGQGGSERPIDSPAEWTATTQKPADDGCLNRNTLPPRGLRPSRSASTTSLAGKKSSSRRTTSNDFGWQTGWRLSKSRMPSWPARWFR